METDKKTLWVLATVIVLLGGVGYVIVAAYARGFSQRVESVDADAEATPAGPVGAPTREQVSRLHDALRKRFGTNARGVPRVAHLDYDGWPDRMHVVLALDHNPLTMTPAQAAELRPMVDVLHAVHAAGLQWRWVLVSCTAPAEVTPGQVTEATVVRASIAREHLDKLDWSSVTTEALAGMAEQFTLDAALEEVRKSAVAKDGPVRRPAPSTAPSAADAR